MKPRVILPRSRRSASHARIAVTAVAATMLVYSSDASDLTWDSNTGSSGAQDGAGTWNTANTNWWDGAVNVSFVAADNVTFGAGSGNAGTVTLNESLSVGFLTFDQPGGSRYTLSAPGSTYYTLTATGGVTVNAGFPRITGNGSSGVSTAFSGTYTREAGSAFQLANKSTGLTNVGNLTGDVINGVLVGAVFGNSDLVLASGTTSDSSLPSYVNDVWAPGNLTKVDAGSYTALGLVTGALQITGNNHTLDLAAGTSVIETGMITAGAGALTTTIQGEKLTSGNGKDLILIGGDSAYNLVISSEVTDNGATPIGVTVATSKASVLNGANTYTGNTVLLRNLTVGNDDALGTGSLVFADGQLSANTPVTLSNDVVLQSSGSIGGTVSLPQDITLSGDISGANWIYVNSGAGGASTKLTLSGNNSFAGSVQVGNGNTLAIGSATAAGNGVQFGVGATLTSADASPQMVNLTGYNSGTSNGGLIFGLPGTGDLTVTSGAAGASSYLFTINNDRTLFASSFANGFGGSYTKAGLGTMVLTGSWSMTAMPVGGFTISEGALQIGDGGTDGGLNRGGVDGTITGAPGTSLIFKRSDSISTDIPITGDITVVQAGDGITTLTAANTYTGDTEVNTGTLALVGASLTSDVVVADTASLGFTVGSPASTTATVTFNSGATVRVTGSPAATTLMTASSFDGVLPTLSPAISGWGVEVDGVNLNLVESTGSAYETWAATNAPGQDSSEDFDLDGVANGVEFVVGGTALTNDLSKLPTVTADATKMYFTFFRDQSSIAATTTVDIQVGTDLATWPTSYNVPDGAASADPGVTVLKDNPSVGTDTVTLSVLKSSDTKKFARLMVSPN